MEFCLLMKNLMSVCATISPHLYRLCNYVLQRLGENDAACTGKSEIRTAWFPAAGKAYKAIGWPTPGAEYTREPLTALGFGQRRPEVLYPPYPMTRSDMWSFAENSQWPDGTQSCWAGVSAPALFCAGWPQSELHQTLPCDRTSSPQRLSMHRLHRHGSTLLVSHTQLRLTSLFTKYEPSLRLNKSTSKVVHAPTA